MPDEILHIIHLLLLMPIVWSCTWPRTAPLDQEGGGADFDGSVLWDLEMLDSLKWHPSQGFNQKMGWKLCWLVIFPSIFWGLHLPPMLLWCCVCDLCLLRICCREQPKTSWFETEGFPNTFWSELRAGPQEHGSCFSDAGRRTLIGWSKWSNQMSWWNFDGWAATSWFREDIMSLDALISCWFWHISYIPFWCESNWDFYQHSCCAWIGTHNTSTSNPGWLVATQHLYPGGGWCHGFAMAWGAAPRP